MASTVYNVSSLSNQMSAIETLTGNNYVRWKRDVEIALGLLGLDFAMEKKLEKPTDKSTVEYVAEHEKWERANKLCLKIIKRSISDSILGAIPDNENAKNFMDAIGEKAETGDLMDKFMSMKYDGTSGVREHVMKMINISSKLKALDIPIAESFLVYNVLNSLPSKFNQLKVAYNAQRDKWNLNDLIAVCAQEEYRMRRETIETVQLAFQPSQNKEPSHNHKSKFRKGNKSHRSQQNKNFSGPKGVIKKNDQCKFCKKKGHWQKDCFKFKTWLEKKKSSSGIYKQTKAK
ncbi:UBN2 domain-containing [Olea europaea subsp. europaea]|uniref:UBN2 domain-containing, partial n=1 Tax=Olea europaea subsp. europaea TaxID=158383 RepID=A0A8S0U625_OLEEU|nr:UBN2 domain-containing [Olea europaea subsp. europaea]